MTITGPAVTDARSVPAIIAAPDVARVICAIPALGNAIVTPSSKLTPDTLCFTFDYGPFPERFLSWNGVKYHHVTALLAYDTTTKKYGVDTLYADQHLMPYRQHSPAWDEMGALLIDHVNIAPGAFRELETHMRLARDARDAAISLEKITRRARELRKELDHIEAVENEAREDAENKMRACVEYEQNH